MRIVPAGDRALVADFGNVISEDVNRKVNALKKSLLAEKAAGVREMIPTYRSLLVEYNPAVISMQALRARIDVIDEKLLELLKDRNDVSRAIGEYKRSHNVAIIQAGRWEQLLADMVERAGSMGISEDAITAIMTAIHEESVRVQNDVLEG